MSYEEASGPELIVQHTGQIFPLGAEPVTIGSQQDNVIVLADPQVSPRHAMISWQAEMGTYAVEDLGSTEGTFLNEGSVEGIQTLRHGDVLRLGNTFMDLRLQPFYKPALAAPALEEPEKPARNPVLAGLLIAFLVGVSIFCVLLFATVVLTGGKATPVVIIQSPAAGAQIEVGNEIILQATASGAKDIILLELNVDGSLVASSTDSEGTSSLTVRKAWRFAVPGEHVISADAYTASGKTSRPASVTVTVVGTVAQATATPPPPDEPTDTPVPTDTATPKPEDTATPMPSAVPPPQIAYFQASPSAINVGGCATLQWGRVANATEATIAPDIGGVATPGSQQVCPHETTTYFLTAIGPGGSTQAATTVTVIGALPDLTIDSITFDPNPAVVGQETAVQIAIRNAGMGAAGAFNWDWTAGGPAAFDGRIFGLNPGDSTVVTVNWIPDQPDDGLTTKARVDTDNEVAETDEDNNSRVEAIQVIELPSEPETVMLKSTGTLDGYRLNDGSGSNTEDILVGNGDEVDPVGELVARGFMSFDLSGIPAGATVDSAELRFYQKQVQGDPYGKLGNLMLEHVYYGGVLDDSAYNTPGFDSALLELETSPGAWYIISDPTILSWVQSSLQAAQGQFQLRLQFRQETDGDMLEDWVSIEPGGGALGSRSAPQLTITYTP